MFELDSAITNWRNSLLCNQNITDGNADELESHLRDEVDSLILSGLSDQEAFMISTNRIGDHREVGQEFAKVNPTLAWRRRAFWMFFGILVSMVVSGIASFCSNASLTLLAWFNIDAYVSGVMSTLSQIGMFIILLFTMIFGLSLFVKAVKHKLSLTKVLVFSIVSLAMLKAGTVALTILQVNYLGADNLGKIMVARNYTNFAWSILWPLIVVIVLFVLWSSRPQRVR